MWARSQIARAKSWPVEKAVSSKSIRKDLNPKTQPRPQLRPAIRIRKTEREKRMDLMNNNLWRVKVGLAEMLKGGVIMDVTTAAQAKIAEDAGACAVMALE